MFVEVIQTYLVLLDCSLRAVTSVELNPLGMKMKATTRKVRALRFAEQFESFGIFLLILAKDFDPCHEGKRLLMVGLGVACENPESGQHTKFCRKVAEGEGKGPANSK